MQTNRWMWHLGAFSVACLVLVSSLMGRAMGAAAAPAGWTTGGPSGAQILNPVNGQPFVITGINWYGFETTGYVAHGLYAKDYTYIVNDIKQYGYNTIRIPFSNQMWETDPIPNPNTISACSACQGKHSRDILALIPTAGRACDSGGSVDLRLVDVKPNCRRLQCRALRLHARHLLRVG